jgi:hypothetical protein
MGYFLIESALPPSLSATAPSSNGFIAVLTKHGDHRRGAAT